MRRNNRIVLASFLVFNLSASLFAIPPNPGPIPEIKFNPPKPTRHVLSNGIVVYLLEDHELPTFHLKLQMKLSPADEPASKPGTLQFFGQMWRAGGTENNPPEKLNDQLEFLAASVESFIDEERAGLSLSSLSEDKDKVLSLFSDLLFHPLFRNDQLEIIQSREVDRLRRKNDTPLDISRRAVRDVLYGPDHYYARDLTETQIKAVTKEDIQAFYKKVVVPDTAMISASGDFNSQSLIQQLEDIFKEWKPVGRKITPYDYSLKKIPEGKNFFIDKDFNQSRIVFVNLSVKRFDPDKYALEVTNYILGGGGPSRLFGEIRSRLGLAYMVGSFYSELPGLGMAGVVCQTKVQSTIAAMKAIKVELDKLSVNAPSNDEMRLAKDSLINSYVFRFESLYGFLSEQADLEFYGGPANYLEEFPEKIKAVTTDQVVAMSKKYFSSDKLKLILVGRKSDFDGKLEDFGPTVEIPLKDLP